MSSIHVNVLNPQAMQLLLTIGANVLDIDTYGNTAVHYAAYKGHTKVRGVGWRGPRGGF